MFLRLLVLGFFAFAFSVFFAPVVMAVNMPAEESEEEIVEESDDVVAPIKRVFSSDLVNQVESKKLDLMYQDIETVLWDMSQTDQIHQRGLMILMEPMKFQYTRRLQEFKPPLDKAMSDLNKNRRAFKEFVQKQKDEFSIIKTSFQEEEKKAEQMWGARIGELDQYAERYFRSQKRYLDTYNGLVRYIMERAGGYYYDTPSKQVEFYKVEEYTFFAESIDMLNKISFKQRESLEKIRPSEITP